MPENRTLHRWIAIPLVLFFVAIAVTGVALQADLWISGNAPPGSEPSPPPLDLSDEAIRHGVAKAIALARSRYPDAAFTEIVIASERGAAIATIRLATTPARTIRVDLAGGVLLPALPPPEKSWHYILQDIHAGYFAGPAGRIASLVSGLGLLVLSITGARVYWILYQRRRKAGRRKIFWR